MSDTRPELSSLEMAIANILSEHRDTSLASQASREMLAEQLASGLCKDAGVDLSILNAFYQAMIKQHVITTTDGMSVAIGIDWFDWLEGLLHATIKEMRSRGFSIYIPSKGW